jgi:hypothetical protein
MIKLNEAEWLVEPFYECTARGLAWAITGGEGVDARLYPNWQAAELVWSDAPAGALVARLACDYDMAIADVDRLCLRVAHADDQQVSVKARIDGVEHTIVDRAPGCNAFGELEGPIKGRHLESLVIEVNADTAGDGRVSLLWILAIDSAARARYRERLPVFDPAWPVFLDGNDKPLEPLLGLFLPDGVDGLRRRAASDTYANAWADIRKRAGQFRQSRPEEGVREHLARMTNGRYEHDLGPTVGEDTQISPVAMELCALAGLVDNDADLARVALRHVLAAAHCGHWDDSFMMTRPGALWDHRAFTAMSVVQGFVRAVDWAGALLTPTGRELVARALSEKALPKVDYSLRKYAYMRENNQAIFFAATGILAVCALGRLLERGGDGLQWYLDVLCESVRNYYLRDGGTYEGGAYHDASTSQAITAFEVASRFLGSPLDDMLPPELLRAGHYYRVMGATAAPGGVINTSDGGRCGLRMQHGAVPALARITGDTALLNMTAQLCEPDGTGTIPGAERVLVDGPESLPASTPSAPVFEILPQTGILCSCRPTSDGPVRLQVVGAKAHAGHGHEDKGSLVLEAFGEELLVDRGTCFYGDARSDLLKKAWRHNLLTPDDAAGRPVEQVNPLPVAVIPQGNGDERTLRAEIDASAGWPELLATWHRSVTSDEPCRFTLRDVAERLAEGTLSIHFQSRSPWVARGQSWESRGGSAGVRITPAWPVAHGETCEDLFDSAYVPVYRLSLHTPPGLLFDLETTIEVFKQ